MRAFSRIKLRIAALCVCTAAAAPLWSQANHTPAVQQQAADQRFLLSRGIGPNFTRPTANTKNTSALPNMQAARQQQSRLLRSQAIGAHPEAAVGSSTTTWQPLGPLQLSTPAYGLVTGRVSSLAVDPNDPTGNTVYLGATGGGVWVSTGAAGNAGSVTFKPLTDDLSVFANSFQSIPSLSIGAVSVEPGNPQVLLAGTGDPNDALDSYYGVGILRSTNAGNSWSLIQQSSDATVSGTNYSFEGVGFAGFAWSTTTNGLVVAAVSQSLEGLLVNTGFETTAETGLYYSQDSGQTWHLATVSDGTNEIIQSTNPATSPPGNAATAVIWNPQRQLFIAAVRFHGYYSSSDGINWSRLANQPGANLTAANCPANPGSIGSSACPIFRGALAVQPVTGDTFALTTDINNADQGLFRDVCSTSGVGVSSCASSTVSFGNQLTDTALDDPANPGTIDQADYNLSLAALASQQDTILFAGTEDIYRCSLANSCAWRNTTNNQTCDSAQVAPSTHAIAGASAVNGLVYFGNDGGIWRSTDDVAQTGSVCAATDASHYQNLNGGLGSLAEVSHLAVSPSNASLVLAGMGNFGVVASESAAAQSGAGAWQQLLTGQGSYVAIDPANPANWFASVGEGVSIFDCTAGGNCASASNFEAAVSRSDVEDDADYFLDPAPWTLDPGNTANMLLGTCRMWLGPATGGWTASNLLSGMLDGSQQSFCDGNAYLRSVAAGGSYNSSLGGERMYAGMAGPLDGGGSVPGHLYGATVPQSAGKVTWTDLWNSPVTNTSLTSQFNGSGYAIGSIAVDPSDTTGQTVYAGVSGFPSGQSGILYRSTDGGAHWTNITNSLPFAPVNAIVVDPSNPSYVYVAGDFGVYYTANVANCSVPAQNCWGQLGAGLPNAPITDLKVAAGSSGNILEAGTYGRGIWTLGLTTRQVSAQAALAPTSYTFPAQAIGSASPTIASFTLSNKGSIALAVNQITVSGDYAQTNNCGTALAVNATCTIHVTFTPTTTGDRPGTLTAHTNAQTSTLSAMLDGTGLTPGTLTLTPTALSFPQTATGANSQPLNVTAQNTGGAPLTLGASTIAGADPNDFTVSSGNTCKGTLAVNASCTVPVIFNPLNTGARSAQLQIAANASGSPFIVALAGNAVSPAQLTLTPTALSFPTTPQNSKSAAQTITVNNGGQQTAQLGSQSVSGDFLLAGTTCGSTLAPNANCSVSIQFAPTATGSRTGMFVLLSSTAPNGQVQATLAGTGTAAGQVSLSPASLAFGIVAIGSSSSQTATFSNQAGSPATLTAIGAGGDYAVTGGTCTLAAAVPVGDSCTITVTFTPSTTGSRTGTLALNSTGTPQTLQTALSGTGATPAAVVAGTSSVAFGAIAVGNSASQSVTVTNSGGVSAPLGNPAVSGSGFSLGSNGCGTTLAANSSCVVQVTFTPAALGSSAGAFTLGGQFTSSPVSVALSGTGVASVLSFQPSPVAFGSITDGTTVTQAVTVTNTASQPASLGAPTVSGGFGLASSCGASLQVGASCTVQVSFSPTNPSAYSGVLTIPTPGSGNPSTDALSGTGLAPGLLGVSPPSLSFTSIAVGSSSAPIPVTFRNSGGSPLTLKPAQLSSNDYTLSNDTCGTGLAAGGSCTIDVAFTPTASGDRSATLTLASTTSNTVQVPLDGSGIAPASLAFSPASLNFSGQYVNTTSASQTFTLQNPGGLSTQLGAPTITGPFSITGNTCGATLAASGACSIAVQSALTAGGPQNGSLRIAAPGGTPSATATLTGTGLVLSLAPSSIAFTPPLGIGVTSAPIAVAINNLGLSAVPAQSITITGDFALGSSSCGSTIPADTTCAVYITFTPTAAGLRTGVFTVSNGSETHSVQLAGTGLSPATDALAPTALTFPATVIGGQSAAQSVSLTNSGDSTLAQISTTVTGPFLASNNCGASLGGHLACAIAVAFVPIATGNATGTLTVKDAQHTQTVALNGTGLAPPKPFASPESIDFGSYAVNVATPPQTITVTNGGGVTMENVAVAIQPAQFAIASSNCGTTLAPGASCALTVTFQTAAPGNVSGALQLTSSSLTEPLTVALAGAGEDYALAVVGSNSAVVTAGQTATYQLSVTPVGSSAGTVTIGCSGAPAGSTCTANPSSVTLSGGASGSVMLSIATGGPASTTTAALHASWPARLGGATALALVLPVFFRRRRLLQQALLLLAAALLLGSPIACGVHASGASQTQTKSGSYTVTVSASFPGAQRTATVTLVVQ